MKTFKQKAKKLCQNKKISVGASFLIILLLAMYVLPSQNPYESSDESLLTSSWDHLLGTDTSGFDLYSRVLEGGKISLKISFFFYSYQHVNRVFFRRYIWLFWRNNRQYY